MFNILTTTDDMDFFSLYFSPSIYNTMGQFSLPTLRYGIAFEHRFGDKRRFGIYINNGVFMGPFVLPDGPYEVDIEYRSGFQGLLGKRFSITLEQEFILNPLPVAIEIFGGKVALSWAFDMKKKAEPVQH